MKMPATIKLDEMVVSFKITLDIKTTLGNMPAVLEGFEQWTQSMEEIFEGANGPVEINVTSNIEEVSFPGEIKEEG